MLITLIKLIMIRMTMTNKMIYNKFLKDSNLNIRNCTNNGKL